MTPHRARRAVLALVLTALLAPGASRAQEAPPRKLPESPRVQVVHIQGRLPKTRPAAILLPTDYGTSGRRYPVLYLLHGLDGAYDNWLTLTDLVAYTADLPLIVVMPDAGDSWYANAVTDTTQKFEDYVNQDVVDWVDAHYRTLAFGADRFIAGLSMGGYGAVMLATKHPGRYAVAASLSGAFSAVIDWTHPTVVAAFGPPGSEGRKNADATALLKSVKTDGLPYYYLDIGTGDGLLPGNREVTEVLRERKIPYEYHEERGVHGWEFWNRRIPFLLSLIRDRIEAPPR